MGPACTYYRPQTARMQTMKGRKLTNRMKKEHPGEEDTVIMRGRVMGGLQPTRAFGDASYKWTRSESDQ